MKLIEKLKNVFFEEVPEDEDEEELPQTFAKKIEPKKTEPPVVHEMKREEKPTIEEDFEEEEEKVEIEPEEEKPLPKEDNSFPMMFDDDDFLEDTKVKEENEYVPPVSYRREEKPEKELYQGKRELSYIESVRKPNYSYTKSYYEEKETKGFKPSPIISPVYGVLDKNYRKEEVVTKKEIKLSTGKSNFDLDTVRNKAFGKEDEEISDKKTREARMEEKEDKRIYDVNNNKPQVNRVTLADADEYYNDLGLAYNVDYSDASRSNNTRSTKYNNKNNKKDKEVDDNLFDLIDSMYNKED
jgi:hypothetical protein